MFDEEQEYRFEELDEVDRESIQSGVNDMLCHVVYSCTGTLPGPVGVLQV